VLAGGYKALKALVRSRSLKFTRDYLAFGAAQSPEPEEASVRWWSGDGRPVYYRRGTSDLHIAYDVLFKPEQKSEYWLPEGLDPRVILDIGGNIGIVARYLAHRFPSARVHSFEPIPDNQRMLAKNAAESGNVVVHAYGLGAHDGTFEFRIPGSQEANRGSYSFVKEPLPGAVPVQARVRDVKAVLASLGSAHVDVIKIDVEGAEHQILHAIPDEVLARATWVYGELHSEQLDRRLPFGVLERLAAWFDIEVHKGLRKRNWFFDACNLRASDRFRRFRRAR
jgi:FkbM family methyltransferase